MENKKTIIQKIKDFFMWNDLGNTGIPLFIWFILIGLMIYISINNIMAGFVFVLFLVSLITFTSYSRS